MNDGRIAMRGWQVIVVLLLMWAGIATAQQDPLGDLGDDAPEEAPPEEAPPDEAAPEEAPVDEGPPAEEPAVDPDAGVGEPLEGELAGDGGVAEELVPEEPPPSGEGSEMVVTGSRIRRSNFAQPAAVQIMDRKQLTQSGAQTMTDVVKTMSINSGSDLNTDVSTGTAGSAQFNLRGLGVSSTLVLLNGRRLPTIAAVSGDGSTFVDINTVPLGIIERVEVLKGGASAIYGSDAVAGVVNMLTRKRMDGFEAHIGAQTTDDLDHHEWDVSLLGGAQGERTRVIAGLGYFKREPLYARDREFTDNNRNISRLGWPSTFLRYQPTGAPRTVMNPITGMLGGATYLDPGCGVVPRSAPLQTETLNFCTFNFNDYFMLMINEERANVYTSLEHDLSDHTMAFFEASYARSRASRTLSPSYALLSPIYVPADHPYNPTGDRLRWYGRVAGGTAPPYETDYDSDTLHTVAGIGGDWGGLSEDLEEWEWEISGTWSGNRYQVFAQDVLKDNLQEALDACSGGGDPADCWNPFSFGPANSQELIDRVHGELRSKADSTLTTAGVDLTGPLFGLPGGDLKLAVGGQIRIEQTKSNPDHDSNEEAFIFLIGGPDWEADRRIAAGYGELLLPFFQGFELQAAGRFEDYNDVGSSMDPMFGISWTPATTFAGDEAPLASKVRLRGTFSTAFRAPSLLQGNGALTELSEIRPFAADAMGNPMASAATFTAVRTFGNQDLSPQRSTTITGGFEWSPAGGVIVEADYWNYSYKDIIIKENAQRKVAEDFAMHSSPDITYDEFSGQPSEIRVRFINDDEVMTHGIDFGVNARTDFGGTAGTFWAGANASYVLAYLIPQSSVPTALWDEDIASCDVPTATAAAPPADGSMCDVAGLRNISTSARSLPRLRVQFPLGWTLDGHTAAVNTNLIGSYTDDNDTDLGAAEDYNPISAWMTFDLQYSYKLEETEHMSTTFRVGVTNLLDTPPPNLRAGLGYDVTTHDPRGRLIYGKLIQEF